MSYKNAMAGLPLGGGKAVVLADANRTKTPAMLAAFGPVLKGSDLVRALGFDTMEALRQAKRQKRVGVTVFTAPARKGLFAYTCDVADWLCDLRMGAKGGEP